MDDKNLDLAHECARTPTPDSMAKLEQILTQDGFTEKLDLASMTTGPEGIRRLRTHDPQDLISCYEKGFVLVKQDPSSYCTRYVAGAGTLHLNPLMHRRRTNYRNEHFIFIENRMRLHSEDETVSYLAQKAVVAEDLLRLHQGEFARQGIEEKIRLPRNLLLFPEAVLTVLAILSDNPEASLTYTVLYTAPLLVGFYLVNGGVLRKLHGPDPNKQVVKDIGFERIHDARMQMSNYGAAGISKYQLDLERKNTL